ncbi:TrbC/VirB2 family protein [Kribbella shirazensis]|jgi:type IV secretory pathway VirB2 component (pilin)|uniref:Type IV secretory pathway VirB2 component (Pilin) n=1 Tax=Kribbella shirazensis TaxID=1105143 RepID=A0A7X5ZZX2_9ACTN|nr:TrbC/VirB2 family protein [Kribbella shirazensis]NIK55564.1 type IV secretory pathway VirB2 component (pilin) [Kribbella shirazensis]
MMLLHLVSELPNVLPLEAPPAPVTEGLNKVLGWVKWIAYLICALGIIIAGAMMAIGQRRGEGGEHAARLGWVLAACIVIGAATALVDALK